ncbi:unnamed protein product, partial [Amoebophrya sp. A120]|eukprot:GSA120T00023983001.1
MSAPTAPAGSKERSYRTSATQESEVNDGASGGGFFKRLFSSNSKDKPDPPDRRQSRTSVSKENNWGQGRTVNLDADADRPGGRLKAEMGPGLGPAPSGPVLGHGLYADDSAGPSKEFDFRKPPDAHFKKPMNSPAGASASASGSGTGAAGNMPNAYYKPAQAEMEAKARRQWHERVESSSKDKPNGSPQNNNY